MRMERLDWDGDVMEVMDQGASELVDLLCNQDQDILENIFDRIEPSMEGSLQTRTFDRDRVSAMVDYLRTTDPATCTYFVNSILDYCKDIPLPLETTLLSISDPSLETNIHLGTNNTSSTHHEKRPRLDYLQNYTDALKSRILKKHKTVTQGVVRNIGLEETWVHVGHRNVPRMKERSNQPQTLLDSREKLSADSLLKNTSEVVLLLGQAGSGKTLLVHRLGHRWTEGSFPSIDLLFLLEFRQLNMISQNLSLKELLFLFYPPCEEDEEQSEVVISYICSHPEKVCFIFDGYDEFQDKLSNPRKLPSGVEFSTSLSIKDLLSGLCNRLILPKCTILITCRPRDLMDMFKSSCIYELQGFDRTAVRKYAEQFFQEKGENLKSKAVSLLMENRHLLSMSHVPGLCHICCVCLDHLFSSGKAEADLPRSLTQIYMQILMAFLRRFTGSEMSNASLLRKFRSQIDEMSNLALQGLEKKSIIFRDTDVSINLQRFGVKTGILSHVTLTCEDKSSRSGFTFMHLTMQEFLAALHLMTSQKITERQLKNKMSLKTRWTAKTDPKSVFTDSLHLYVCGLAAESCASILVQLIGREDAASWIQSRQNTVRKVLCTFSGSSSQTGPKIVELCRCVHETQDEKLAWIIGSRSKFEMRNIWLNPVDMEALAFVIAAADQNVCLDFSGCSIELECLEIFPSFKNVDHLIFHSRKYEDRFAEALCSSICKLQALQRLEFISGGLTCAGAAKLAATLPQCPQLKHLDLRDNALKDEGILMVAKALSTMPNFSSALMGKNIISTDGVFALVEEMAVCPSVNEVYVEANAELRLGFSHSSDGACEIANLKDTNQRRNVVLRQRNISSSHVTSLCNKLKHFSSLSTLDLSSNTLGNEGLIKLLDLLPKLPMVQELNVSDNAVDLDGVLHLASALSTQNGLRRVEASGSGKEKLLLWFDTRKRSCSLNQPQLRLHTLCLTNTIIHPAYMEKLCERLVKCKILLEIQFSHLKLSDESAERLLLSLSDMTSLHLLNLSGVTLSSNGALLLVRSLAECRRVTAVEFRDQGEAFIRFVPDKAVAAICKLTEYTLGLSDVEELSRILEDCPHLAELELSRNRLRDEGVKCLVGFLPKLKISSSVSLSGNRITQVGALHLVNSMNTCEKVAAIEVSLGVEDQSLIRFVQEHVSGKTLRLKQCSFELSHVQKLVEILNKCPRLLTLQLSSNQLHSQSQLYLLEALAKLPTIQNITLQNNSLQSEHIECFVKQLGKQQWNIWIEEPWLTGKASVGLIAKCLNVQPNIRDLRIERTSVRIITYADFSPRSSSRPTALLVSSRTHSEDVTRPALQSISFDENELEGKDLSPLIPLLMECHGLQKLTFSQLSVDQKAAEFFGAVIPSLPDLRNLTIDMKGSTEGKVVVLAETLPKSSVFESLSLSNFDLRDDGSSALGRALQKLPNLKSFNLSRSSGWTAARAQDVIEGLAHSHFLIELQLDSVVLDAKGVHILSSMFGDLSSLRRLSLNKIHLEVYDVLRSSEMISLLASFKDFRQIEEMELENWRMGESGVHELVKHLVFWTKLQQLSLSDNDIHDQAGEKLVSALSRCRSLQKLNLSKNKLGRASADKLAEILPLLPQLSELHLSENCFDAEGCRGFSKGLVSLKSLKTLHLMSIGTPDLVAVAESLRSCPCIEDVSLSWNECDDRLTGKLAEVLPFCSRLKRLDLEANKISTSGAVEMSRCLPSCPDIQVVRLWRNPIAQDDENLKDKRLNFSSV